MAVDTAAELEPVAHVTARLQALQQHARALKPDTSIDPALPSAPLLPEVDALHDGLDDRYDLIYKFNAVETAARKIYYRLLNTTAIDDPSFVEIWNLLDILALCGDRGTSAPELVCYLLEELLDSQTTAGCRTVFDYLESRRERLAAKDFHKKNLIFLRSCNELLRRLSRAEDAIFCGRVFFFLFQTFPLGDKSSVNLRGEFHVENVTKFLGPESHGEGMSIDDTPAENASDSTAATPTASQITTRSGGKGSQSRVTQKAAPEVVLSNNELYPIFWRLQQDFSEPTRLFHPTQFKTFKEGLGHTLVKFKKTPTVVQTKHPEDGVRGMKRKLEDGVTEDGTKDKFVDNYNPKYLTSRDLFDLELSDLAFQRHIMLQALILIDFLLSLTEKAKKKLATVEGANKSMLYSVTLSEEDAKWCRDTRQTITEYLRTLPTFDEGRFYHRMVETVLARDKNWVRWKVESCPSIVRETVSTDQMLEARRTARNVTRPRRVPPRPMGAIDLSFLAEGQGGGLEALKDPSRYVAPSVEDLIEGVKMDKLDLEMAMHEGETAKLQNAIDNKTWRALRQVRARDLSLLNKVDPGRSIEELYVPANTNGHRDLDVVGETENDIDFTPTELDGDAGIETPGYLVQEDEKPSDVVTRTDDDEVQTDVATAGSADTAHVDAVDDEQQPASEPAGVE